MTPGAVAALLVTFMVAATTYADVSLADVDRVRDCMPPGQARELLIEQKFIAPFRALKEAVRSGQGEAVGVQLCRLGDGFVYDITLLQRDGRVGHSLVNARTGLVAPPARAAK